MAENIGSELTPKRLYAAKAAAHVAMAASKRTGRPVDERVRKLVTSSDCAWLAAEVNGPLSSDEMVSSPAHLDTDQQPVRPTLDDLLSEYDNWRGTLDRDTDDHDSIAKLAALYRFAITHYDQPGIELLLDAIVAIEGAQKER